MIGCLIIYRTDHLVDIIKVIIEEQFKNNDYELIIEKNQIVIFSWNTEKTSIWQLALLFELSSIIVGYGFHDYPSQSKNLAKENLTYRLLEETKIKART